MVKEKHIFEDGGVLHICEHNCQTGCRNSKTMVGHAKMRRSPTKSSVVHVEVLETVIGDLDGIRQFGYGAIFVLRKFVNTFLQ